MQRLTPETAAPAVGSACAISAQSEQLGSCMAPTPYVTLLLPSQPHIVEGVLS